MNLSLFIARRIYSGGDLRRKVSRPAMRIATAGVAIGLTVMLVSVGIVLGFKHTIRDKVIGFGGNITVGEYNSIYGRDMTPVDMPDSMMRVLSSIEGVSHVQRYALKQGILKTDSDFLGVVFKGVAQEYDTTFIRSNLVSGSMPAFSDSVGRNKILVSQIMADRLRLKAGDKVFAYFIDNGDVRVRRFTVSGIYQTNLSQFDKSLCFADLYTTVRLNDWDAEQVSGAEVTVSDFSRLEEVAERFVSKVNRTVDKYGVQYSSETVQRLNPQIFTWLDLLDLNVWIILALMLCVAGFTMISGLLIIILERTSMIGLLKALGARNKTIRKTILWFAVFIIGRGLAIGNVVGIGLMLLQKYTGVVKLDAATYYVETVPVEINVPLIILINVATLLISVFVLIAPSYLASRVRPAASMRYE